MERAKTWAQMWVTSLRPQCEAFDTMGDDVAPLRCTTPADWSVLWRCALDDEWQASVCDRHLQSADQGVHPVVCSAHNAATTALAAFPLGMS